MAWTGTGTVAAAATGRTTAEMRGLFSIYIEDTKKNEVPPVQVLQLLNTAQDKVVTLLNPHILEELNSSELAAALDDTDGYYDFSGLNIFHNKAMDIQLTDGKFCSKISFAEYKKYVSMEKVYTTYKPIYYIRGTCVYIQPFGDDTTIDIYYQVTPTDLSIDPEVNCGFDDHIADIIIGLACENFVDKTNMAKRAYDNAMKSIYDLNMEFPPTDSVVNNISRFRPEDEPEENDARYGRMSIYVP